jgi:ABC-type transport system involved in Fe-S cluster assembly fused permease/ATPase subunit
VQQAVQTLLPIVVELATVAVVLIRLQQEVFMVVFFFALLGYAIVFTHGISRITAAACEASTAQTDERAIMTDSILNYETVKFFTAEQLVASRLDSALSRTEAGWLLFFRSKTLNGLLTTAVFGAFLAVTTGYAVRAVTNGSMTVGDFVLVNAYMFQLVRPIEMLGYALQGTSQGLAFVQKMLDLLREPPEAPSTTRNGSFNAAGSLEFRDVGVGYHSDRQVLRGVSFLLPSGKTLGIAGASGAGKSTLVRLLVRLLEPDRGEILLDGQPIRTVSLRQLRESIAVVPQDTMLFDDTIAYNIAFGKPDSTRTEVEEAAKLAHLHDLIMSLPEGYETRVGERGLKLSGGEKQRVSIARAALKRPRIYIFDEATSSLDSRTEAEILQNLQQISQSSTTLIIAHRLSTIVHADQIAVLERGEIAESGTHESLLEANGRYAALWQAQQRTTARRGRRGASGATASTRT